MTVILDEESVEWHSVTDSLPDADTTVIVYAPGADEPVWLGYYEYDEWFAIGGEKYELPQTVKAWASMPLGPQRLWP